MSDQNRTSGQRTYPPVGDRRDRLGADGKTEGLYVRFEQAIGLNAILGRRRGTWKQGDSINGPPPSYVDGDELAMAIQGWDQICRLVDEYREREARHAVIAAEWRESHG